MYEDIWEFYQDETGGWRWRRLASDGILVGAVTEAYRKREDCEHNAEHFGYNGHFNPVGLWTFYEDRDGCWRWRNSALNHSIIGAASSGYKDRTECETNARRHGYQA